MEMKKLKEIVDKVETHLLNQGGASFNNNLDCRYRSDYGLTCAIGCLITDENYSDSIENYPCSNDCVIQALENSLNVTISEFDKAVFTRMQEIHDLHALSPWVRYITNCFRSLRQEFGLN